MRLKDKVALITGAGMGQGQAAALLFADEGAKIVVGDIDDKAGAETVGMIEDAGGEAVFAHCDVSSEADCKALVDKGVGTFGRLDIIYNNAGVLWKDRDKSVVDTKEEDWDAVMGICLKGVYLICKYGIPELKKAGGGSIINIGSISGLTGSSIPQDAYACSKGAMRILTKSLAVQFARDNIRCNVIHPGMIDTPMQHRYMQNSEWTKAVEESIPMGRFGQPGEIAKVALFLASEDSSYMTGAELVVDGGFYAT